MSNRFGIARDRRPLAGFGIAGLWPVLALLLACSGDGGNGAASDAGSGGGDVAAPQDDANPIEIDVPATPRGYRMGVTVTSADGTAEGEDAAWSWATGHGDVVTVRLDGGIPWQEMVDATGTLPAGLEATVARIETELAGTRARRYLIVDLFDGGRTGIAPDSEGRALPDGVELSTAASEALREAYTRYCLLLLERLEPDYFSPIVDINVYLDRRPSDFDAAVALYRALREELKRTRVETQVFPVWSLERLLGIGPDEPARDHISELRLLEPNSDRLGLELDPAGNFVALEALPPDYLARIADTSTRPLVIAGAAYPSSGFQAGPIIFPSSDATQYNYLAMLLEEAELQDVDLLVWRYPYDIQARLEAMCPGRLASQNQPCDRAEVFDSLRPNAASGLLDASDDAKIAAELWDDFFARPLRQTD